MKPGFFTLSHCRWIPWAIVGCFVVVAAMNGGLAYLALESDPGLVSEHPFELGNGYNRVLAEGAAEDALGWRGAADFLPTERLSGWVVATLRDSAGAPLEGLSVKATVVRPIEPVPPQVLALGAQGRGQYSAPITLLRPGQWELRITVARGADVFQFVQRIVVR